MDQAQVEIKAIEDAVIAAKEAALQELSELQTSLIGGGIGDVYAG